MKKIYLFLPLIILMMAVNAFAYTGFSDKTFGRADKSSERLIFAYDKPDLSVIKEPPSDGVFFLTQANTDFNEKPSFVWSSERSGRPLYITDEAVGISETVVLGNTGKTVITRTLKGSSGKSSVIEWEYKVLADDYARLTRRINGGTGINLYDGEPLKSLKLVSIFSLMPLIENENKSQNFELSFLKNGEKENSISLDAKAAPSIKALSTEIVPGVSARKTLAEIPDAELKNGGDSIKSVSFRKTVMRKESVYDIQTGAELSSSLFKPAWDGLIYGDRVPAEPGLYTVKIEISARTSYGTVRFFPYEEEVKVGNYPRLIILAGNGEIIADSRFDGRAVTEDWKGYKLAKPFEYPMMPRAYGYSINRIYMKRTLTDEDFKLKYVSAASSPKVSILVSSSSRNSLPVQMKSLGSGLSEGVLQVSSRANSSAGTLILGNAQKPSYAFIDTTYSEDSEAFEQILSSKGWISRGSIYPELIKMPGRRQFLADFVRSGGYEKFSFTANEGGRTETALLLMRNQAKLFYYSGHGWGDGSIHTGDAHFHPSNAMDPGDWNDGLTAVIFSSCSVFDIMNLHNRKFTHIGNFNMSPGEYWSKAAGPEVSLLGYNWSTFEGKPPNAFDTRVIKSFLSRYLAGANPIDSWIGANAVNNEHLAACAIFNNGYYYLSGGGIQVLPRSRWKNADSL